MLYRCAKLALDGSDFDEYINSLPRRKSIKRDLKSIERSGYDISVMNGSEITEDDATRMHHLWEQLYNKHKSPDQIKITRKFFKEIGALPHAIYLIMSKNGEICAFDLCFSVGKTLESTYCGVDLSTLGRLPVHRAMGYEIVRFAIEHDYRQINFGISNEQTKLDMGCKMEELHGWIDTSPAFLRTAARKVIEKFIIVDR